MKNPLAEHGVISFSANAIKPPSKCWELFFFARSNFHSGNLSVAHPITHSSEETVLANHKTQILPAGWTTSGKFAVNKVVQLASPQSIAFERQSRLHDVNPVSPGEITSLHGIQREGSKRLTLVS